MVADETEPNPFSTRTFRIASLFLLACVIGGALVVIVGPAHDENRAGGEVLTSASATSVAAEDSPMGSVPPGGQTSSAAESTDPDTAAGDPLQPSVCGLAAGELGIPAAPPPAVWQIVGGRIAAPTSPVFGPGVISSEGVGNCFAHSPGGALFAMMQSVALTAVPADRIPQTAVVSQRGSRTNLFAAALQAAHQEDADAATAMPTDPSTLVPQALLGYTFVDYTPGRATIAVAVGIGDPLNPQRYQPSLFTGVVLWEDGDWKFVYSAQTATTMAPILSQGQYTRWAA